LSPGTAETAAAVIQHKHKKNTRMAKRRKTTTKKGKEVLGTRVPIQPIRPCNPWEQMIIILQWQSELKSQEARILGLQNGLQLERIAQLQATIERKDDEMKKKDDDMKKKDEELSKLVDLQTKGEVTINEMQALQAKDEVTILDLEVKSTILEAELAESQERIESFQEDLAKHKVILMNLSRDIFNSLRSNEI
jgi:uncharacterized small protein (DUF1192 family)